MKFSIIAILASLASIAATSPVADASPAGVALRRAINKSYFTPEELADTSKSRSLSWCLFGVGVAC